MPLFEKLSDYNSSSYYPFHMPGHKRNTKSLPDAFPVGIDITEITGFDDLHEADGIILEAENNASNLYGSEKCKFLVGGSTSGILAAILGITRQNDTILIGRNCHKSVYSAVFLNNLKTEYLSPAGGEISGIKAVITPEDVDNHLKNNSDIRGVVIVSPSYEGITSDVEGIAKICHKYKRPLIVDAAHGAHLGFDSYFPESAVKSGADIVIMSLHKTLPALTGTALLHMQGKYICQEKILKSLARVMTSSPSYVFMANMDYMLRDLKDHGQSYFGYYRQSLEQFYKRTKLKNLYLVREKHMDPGKIVIVTEKTSVTGKVLFNLLRDRYHLELEMATPTFAVAMTSIADTWDGLRRLSDALMEIDASLQKRDNKDVIYYLPEPDISMTIREAEERAERDGTKCLALRDATGYISATFVYIYPPGTPIIAPGEIITEETIEVIMSCENSLIKVIGLDDKKINVLGKGL